MVVIPEIKRQRGMYVKWVTSILVLMFLVFGGFSYVNNLGANAADSFIEPVSAGTIDSSIPLFGKLIETQGSVLVAEKNGIIKKIYKYPGDNVNKGDVLIRLENVEVKRALDSAKLNQLDVKATNQIAKAQELANRKKFEHQLQTSIADVEVISKEVESKAQLLTSNAIARLEYEHALSKKKKAELALRLAEENVVDFEQRFRVLSDAWGIREEVANREVEIAKSDVDKLSVKTDKGGIVGAYAEFVELGGSITSSQYVGRVIDPNSLHAQMRMSANYAGKIITGSTIEVDIRGSKVKAQVVRIYPNVENDLITLEAHFIEALPVVARADIDVVGRSLVSSDEVFRISAKNFLNVTDISKDVFVFEGVNWIKVNLMLGDLGDSYVEVLNADKSWKFVAFGYQDVSALPSDLVELSNASVD